tara:strand:+ start:4362 stop:5000 length:639 start_codon:yes stop_codon:yes gene_type:complete
MKLLFENWRQYLDEQKETFPYQIYCDMDGVLVDFMSATLEQINKDLKDKTITGKNIDKLRKKLAEFGRDEITAQDLDKMDKKNRLQAARNYMYRRFDDDEEFWANLPWADGGKELWDYISKFNPYILTAPMKGEGSKRGKELWIEKNLDPLPKEVFMSHEKYNWAKEDGKSNVLIDDFTSNTVPWEDHGGIAILHTDTNKTIQELEEIANEI